MSTNINACVYVGLFLCLNAYVELDQSHLFQIDGEPYWYYEYLVRKSPTKTVSIYSFVAQTYEHGVMVFQCFHQNMQAQEPNLYRHYVASTAERDGMNLLFPSSSIFVMQVSKCTKLSDAYYSFFKRFS